METSNVNRHGATGTTQISRPWTTWLLIGTQIFLAVGALVGGGAFIIAPDGQLIQMPFSHLNNSPFSNFLIPGILLFSFLGIFPLAVTYGLWKQPAWGWPNRLNPFRHMHWSWTASLSAGVITIIWITVQVLWVPLGFVHVFYLVYGGIILGLTMSPSVRRYYVNFSRKLNRFSDE